MSATTIKYTCYFYRLYSQLFENRQGVIDDFDCIIEENCRHLNVTAVFVILWNVILRRSRRIYFPLTKCR